MFACLCGKQLNLFYSAIAMASSEQINWQELHLFKDEASAQGTRTIHFVVQQVEKAQNTPFLKSILNNLMMAHALKIQNYELPAQIPPP